MGIRSGEKWADKVVKLVVVYHQVLKRSSTARRQIENYTGLIRYVSHGCWYDDIAMITLLVTLITLIGASYRTKAVNVIDIAIHVNAIDCYVTRNV